MTQLDYSAQPLYNRNSGRTPVGRLLLALLTILPAVAIAGALYSIISSYLPMLRFAKLVLILDALLMAGFAFGVGALTARLLLWARVRNLGMVWLVAALAAVAAWYVAWVTWEWHLFIRSEDDIPRFALFSGLLTHPRAVWHFATRINTVGTFGIGSGDDMIRGPFLWVLWFIEAAAVLGVATVVPYRMIRGRAFCEACQQWGRIREGILSVGPTGDEDRFRARLALKDLSALEELGAANMSAPRRLRVDLQRCPTCDNMHLLSVYRMEVTYDGQGRRKDKARNLIDHLWLDPSQAKAVEEIKGRIYAGGAAAPGGSLVNEPAPVDPATVSEEAAPGPGPSPADPRRADDGMGL